MSRPLKVVIVGTGFLAHARARCWRRVYGRPIELAVASRDRQRAEAFARAHDIARACTIEEALADPAITLVDLCVSNRAHRELTERAASARKHVLCTKPLAAFWGQGLGEGSSAETVACASRATMLERAVEDAQAMVDACARAGVRLFYGENWIFAPAIRRAVELGAASGGTIRELRGWESHSGSHSPYSRDWRHVGGGALLRLGAHPVGAMLWLKRHEGLRQRGEPVRPISVMAEVAGSPGQPESAGTCAIRFDDGTLGLAHGSDHMLGGMQSHLTILASDHRFECALSPIDTLRAYAPRDGTFGTEPIMEKISGQAGWTTPIPDEDWSSGQQAMLQSVADAQSSGAAPEADGVLGLETVRVLYAAYQSAAEGRRIELR
ncbi:MAG: Gfo/Idh/MocA family oxidoreductase [Planctomycetes bacterium]|nr:Gfo/Idh/MocA family oxidoreductase [Planctomycetota bacterium]